MENREETLDTNLLPPDVRPRFKALSKDELAVQALILDLRHCQPDQDLIRNLHTQARQRIVSLRDRTKELERLSVEQDSEKERQLVLQHVGQHQEQQNSLQVSLRQASLECQTLVEQHQRNALLQAADVGSRTEVTDRAAAESASRVTETLLHLRQTMSGQLERNSETVTVLEASSKTVRDVDGDLRGVGSMVAQSKHLVSKYGRRQITDCLLITLALLVFLATVLYIVLRRVF